MSFKPSASSSSSRRDSIESSRQKSKPAVRRKRLPRPRPDVAAPSSSRRYFRSRTRRRFSTGMPFMEGDGKTSSEAPSPSPSPSLDGDGPRVAERSSCVPCGCRRDRQSRANSSFHEENPPWRRACAITAAAMARTTARRCWDSSRAGMGFGGVGDFVVVLFGWRVFWKRPSSKEESSSSRWLSLEEASSSEWSLSTSSSSSSSEWSSWTSSSSR
mmetsp:Transcript_6180/g.12174  ORF Transcript_6180/g.12174 Transcript_6180/m.12174 type:complete len:215 (-) Transcript_6180:140-784(-)